jgi:hypothetical protein
MILILSLLKNSLAVILDCGVGGDVMAPCNCCETTCDHGPDACNGRALVEEGYCDSCTNEIFGKS